VSQFIVNCVWAFFLFLLCLWFAGIVKHLFSSFLGFMIFYYEFPIFTSNELSHINLNRCKKSDHALSIITFLFS